MIDRAESVKRIFYLAQILLGGGFVVAFLWFRAREPKSGFRVREADRWKPEGPKFPSATALPPPKKARKATRKAPLMLAGLRIDGPPHEILGIRPDATSAEIQKAYRDLIKRFHPDIVGRPGSREWEDAQRLAEAINRAKDEMLQAAKSKGSR